MSEQKLPSKPTRDPQALSSEYHKARKQLMLWARILFIWELVGIDLEKAKEAGGNAGAIITAIKSPQAVPWVLLILVAYFLFKTTVEWYQCHAPRRSLRVSRIDFYSAWIVSVLAFVFYVGQAMSSAQFADLIQNSSKTQSLTLGFLASAIFVLGLILLIRKHYYIKLNISWLANQVNVNVGLLLMSGAAVLFLQASPQLLQVGPLRNLKFLSMNTNWKFMLIGLGSGSLLTLAAFLSVSFLSTRRVASLSTQGVQASLDRL